MKKYEVNKPFYISSFDGQEMECTCHSIEFDSSDAREEYVGTMHISFGEHFPNESLTIWGNNEADDEFKHDFTDCYVNLPQFMDKWTMDDEETDPLALYDMLEGIIKPSTLGI